MIYLVEIDSLVDATSVYVPRYRLVEAISQSMASHLLRKQPDISEYNKFIFHPIIKQ